MNTKTLSNRALSVIDQYLHFRVGQAMSDVSLLTSTSRQAVCSIPYFNNKTVKARAALRANTGKGSPQEILEEIQAIIVKNHVATDALTDESLKKFLTDNNIGIDCSGFSYYILNAESEDINKGPLDKHISFVNCHGLVGKLRCSLRPIENCDVATLAHDKNSRTISLKDVQPGDMITMIGGPDNNDRDHILVIHQVEYQNFVPTKIHYSHVMAYPEDGIYGTGVKQGVIEIIKPEAGLLDQKWNENGKDGANNRIFIRAQKSETEIRRLKWFA